MISSSEALTYAVLLGIDSDPVYWGFGNTLSGSFAGFVTPVYVPGSWQLIAVGPPGGAVPDGGPGALAAVAVVGMGIVARHQRRKRLAA